MKKTNKNVVEETVVEATVVEQEETAAVNDNDEGFVKKHAKKIAVAIGVVVVGAGALIFKHRRNSAVCEEVSEEVPEEPSESFEETPEE